MTSYEKLLEEMDVVDFVRSMRYMKALMRVLLSKREHQLVLRLRGLNLQRQLSLMDINQTLIGFSNFYSFRKSGIEKVHAEYVN